MAKPLHDSDGTPVYTLKAAHPKFARISSAPDSSSAKAAFLTNHHVAQPWWKNDELAAGF